MENIIEKNPAKAINLTASYKLIRRIEGSREKSKLTGKERYDYRKDLEAYLSGYILPLLSGTSLLERKIYIAHPVDYTHSKTTLLRVHGIDEDGDLLLEYKEGTASFYLQALAFMELEQLIEHLEPLCF